MRSPCSEGTLPLLEVAPSPPVLVEPDHARQVDLGQPPDLLPDAGLPAPEPVPACLELLPGD